MKPIRLKMQAFGSYGKLTDIDFTKPNQNLFLITGDTGAGKTTIFDAIVFALYGEASSADNKKSGQELQSQFVETGVEPFVELIFTEGSCEGGNEPLQTYMVRRVPRHQRPKKKGSGNDQIDVKETVELTLPDGTLYSGKKDETDSKIREIIGLEKDQFMQVGMIAQGEFMKLLRSPSDKKKVIFQKLFHTQTYDDFVKELAARKKIKDDEMRELFTECRTEVGHIDIPEDYSGAGEIRKLISLISKSEDMDIVNMEKLLGELNTLCEYGKEQVKQTEAEWKTASEKHDSAIKTLSQATELEKTYKQRDDAQKELEECRQEAENINECRKLLGNIVAAYDIKGVYERYEDADEQLTSDRTKKQKLEEEIPGLQKSMEDLAVAEASAKEKFDKESENFARVSEKVKKAEAVFAQISESEKALKNKEKTYKQANEKLAKANGKVEDLKRLEQEWRAQSAKLANVNVILANWEAENGKAEEISEALEDAKKLGKEVELAEKAGANALSAYKKAKTAYKSRNAEYEEKQSIYMDAQAGFLAEKLLSGQPCPVCGSLDHPHPCKLPAESENITKELLDTMAEEVNTLHDDWTQKMAASSEKTQILESKKEAYEEAVSKIYESLNKSITDEKIRTDVKSKEDFTLTDASEQLQNWKESLAERGNAAKADAEKLTEVNTNLAGIDDTKSELEKSLEQAREAAQTAQSEYGTEQTKLGTLKASVEYDSLDQARAVKSEALSSKDEKEKLWNDAHDAAGSAEAKLNQVSGQIQTLATSIPEQEKTVSERKKEYSDILEEKQLSEFEWKSITDDHTKNEADEIRDKITEYEKRLSAAGGLLKASEDNIAGRARPDLDSLRQAEEEAKDLYNNKNELLEKLKSKYHANRDVYRALSPKMEVHADKLKELTRLSGMYNRFAGKQTGARMDIETFVQRYYLEKILDAANARFSDMSAGQYELRMYDLDKASEGKNHGLDLMVYSAVTGKEREVRTLSGGESFMAALALALGMADEIQAHSSAIHLDVMFIDEGFGSLDEVSRNQAIKVLQHMAGSDRMIGIISHVTELKQAIENQLIVTKDENGSSARWQIS